jgi:hypothetical protein
MTRHDGRKRMLKTDVLKDAYVKELLARVMYMQWCRFKSFDPRPYPYSDAGSRDYASIAVDILGYDDDVIKDLEEVVADWSDSDE